MTKQTILILLALAGLIAPASAQSIKGSGNDDCGEWLQHRQSVASRPPSLDRDLLLLNMEESWIDGFISAINATKVFSNADLLAAHPGEGMYVWIDNYCRSKPLDNILTASLALAIDLKARAKRP